MNTGCTPSLFSWGDMSIAWIEEHRTPAFTLFFRTLTDLGSLGPILISIALICWLYTRPKAHAITYAMFFSVLLNLMLKDMINECRPFESFWLMQVHSSSFPSGHAQIASVIWWGLAYYLRHRVWSSLCFLIGLSVILSRPYLGVHYPQDVIVGALLGTLMVGLFIFLEKQNFRFTKQWPLSLQIALYIGFAYLYCAFYYDPESIRIVCLACFFGYWLGSKYESTNDLRTSEKAILLSIGLTGLWALYKGLPLLFPTQAIPVFTLQYILIGLWISFGAPFCTQLIVRKGVTVYE